MNIVFVAAECAPFAKVGGLADVIGALPATLTRLGHSVRVVLPHHGTIADRRFGIEPFDAFDMLWNGSTVRVEVAAVERDGVPHYFIRGYPFFGGHERFIYHNDEGIDVGRFLFLAAATFALLLRIDAQEGWRPDAFHLHDWHTAAVAYLLRTIYADDPILGSAATLFSIHNMQYQGWGIGWHLARAGLPPVDHDLLQAIGRTDNCLAIGLAYCNMLSTVSPRYAQEILSAEGGFGLDGLLHARLSRLVGVLNGVDTVRWNPAISPNLPTTFTASTLGDRIENKLFLQVELGLPQQADVPLVGTVMRLVDQKGPAIMFPALRELLDRREAQFVLLGSGQIKYEDDAWRLGHDFPDRASIRLTFDEGLSERIYAASDLFLMPSLFEPCGIGQMIAMRYGSLPVVREIGGLADTVSPDVGFLFGDYNSSALLLALNRALDLYAAGGAAWQERQRRAMDLDFSWERSAARYAQLYEKAVSIRRSYA